MKPEEMAREKIDQLLEAAGWSVQDDRRISKRARSGAMYAYC